jgi:Na+-driven multidrug efflux pump
VTILRTIILQVPISYLLGITLGFGLNGVWTGIVAANVLAVTITFSWGRYTVEHVIDAEKKKQRIASPPPSV